MALTNILTPTGPSGQLSHTLKVKLTRPARTRETGVILPAGAIGQVIEYRRKPASWFVDFGLLTVVILPVDSSLIEIVT